MAVTTLLSDSSVESVKQAVRSTTTCSNTTVMSLQTLFRGLSKASPETETTIVKRGARSTKTTTVPSRTKSVRATKVSAQEAAINTVAEKDAARLSYQEKLVLATDVFNTTLKTLSDAAKLCSKRDDARVRTANSSPSPTKSPRKLKVSQESTVSAGLDTGLVAVAECASMALSSLRTLKGEQVSQEEGGPNMQLEQGACVLAGRYLSLGLNDMAYKELRSLKRRIQQYMDNQGTVRQKTTSRRKNEVQEEEPAKERMSDLLTFANTTHTGSLLNLLVPFQSNALRLIAAEKKVATVHKIASVLQLSDSSSPANVILAAVESGALTKDKAALQLQLLSNTVLSLSGNSQTSDSNTARDRLKPITSLTLQLLSLEVRCMSWKLSGHTCDEGKEMWDPLTRYLANFTHHNKALEKPEFAVVYKTIVRLQTAVANTQKRQSTTERDNVSVARIAIVLGQLAQEAGCFEEALKLFTEALNPLSSGQCLSLATVRCKIASLYLQASKSSKSSLSKVTNAIADATASLSMPLKGSLSDLDELLVEAAKLKKLTMSAYGDLVTKAGDKNVHEVSRLYEYLPAFLRFLRRYIGRPPSAEEPKESDLFTSRVRASRNIVLSAIDSTLAVGKLSITSQRPAWEDMLSPLTDCQRLLTAIDIADADSDPSAVDQIGTAFVRLSNLFWSRYLKEKERGTGYRELYPLVKHSASLLSTCSPDQRSTGFAALKYERLAYLYLEGNRGAEAEQAFSQSIQEHIDTGVVEELMSSPIFPHRTSQDPKSAGFMLGRVLSAYLKLKLRSKTSKGPRYFDDEAQSPSLRAHILEWQMGILTELHSHAHSDEAFRLHLTSLVSKLLDLFHPEIHPIRRLRVVLGGLRSSLERPNCLERAMLQELLEEGSDTIEFTEYGEDAPLATLAIHLRNSLHLNVGLLQGNLQSDNLNLIISSWKSMMRNCTDGASLVQYVGDIEHCLLQLKAVVDYTEIHGLWKLQFSALELVLRITEIQEAGDFSEAIIVLSRLVQQYCRLGNCKKAADLLNRADQYIGPNTSCLGTLSYKLARVAYLLELGDTEEAATTIAAARVLYEKNQKKQDLNSCSVLTKIAWERLVADAAFMSSQLSFAQGGIKDALFFAKLSVRLNCRIWAKVEKISQRNQERRLPTPTGDNSELDTVVETMAKLDVSQVNPATTSAYTQGAPFWPHIGSHHTSLLNLASLSAHHGLFQDAIYYGEQALKINKTLNAPVRLINSQAQLGSHWILGGRISEGQELLSAAETLSKQLESSIELASLQIGLASLYRAQGQYHDELKALFEADRIMADFVSSDTSEAASVSSGIPELEDKMETLRIRPSSRKAAQPATTTRRTRATTSARKLTKAAAPTPSAVDTTEIESRTLLHLRSGILRQQAACSRSLRDFEKAACYLESARKYAVSRDSQITVHLGESEHFLADAIRHFASHAVYCVLPESTISLPSLQSPSKATPQTSTVRSASKSTSRKPGAPARGTRSRAQTASDDFAVMLSKAGDSLNNVFNTATSIGSTLDSHTASRLMSRISMLSHATAAKSPMTWSQPPANVNEIGRIGAFAREHIAISLDKQLADYGDPLLWPTPSAMTEEPEKLCSSKFAEEYIDILPDNWNVISLSLSADRSEFIVSRLHQGRSPLLLRLPLRRGNSEDDDEQFTFDDGREEMQELIKLANESAHAAKAQINRQMKKDWWRNREALDGRMETLLQNIENVWFGGFRGIFSPMPHDAASLGRFATSFQSILDKHLPSRQKGGRAEGPRLTLHPNVLELFIGVEDLDDQEDPEETLMDLLYFVVDILQFQGERNAYDEIDFDMMVVDTLDAVRAYHDSARNQRGKPSANHTVLVLDKALHLFPWESLPCLQGSPVCRVPSLECLRDRVLQFQHQRDRNGTVSLGINRRSGTYILNPTGDLQTTQSTFEKDLARLPGWTGIAQREPSEEEFKRGLESTSLFLYFGHGSGAQYIRGRTVKRLDQCAVAFLMGCSSGTLTEAGEYEPYGTPMNYLQAGSPALVATLWDVTDKDIDRFAQSTFEKWGLFDEGADAVTLGEAVSQSRAACVLKYLNGAAPVIYGVPSVFLE
ncbi:hypothetical protein BBP40_007655 [Aspergillus hancockii]|nr:hypothetical protein BBP40_007655 [Aspergillus hancockii]